MPDKFNLFNDEMHGSLYDKDGRVQDPEIAHEMAKIEDPYHKRDAFGLITARKSRIKKGEKLAEAAGEKLFRQKQEAARQKREQEYEKNLSEHFLPKEATTIEIGDRKEYDNPQLVAEHAVKLLLKDWPYGFPLNREVELIECVGDRIPASIFDMASAGFPYEDFHKKIIDALGEGLRKQRFSGRATIKPEFKLVGPPDKQKIEGVSENTELYIRTCLYYDEPGGGLLPKIKISATRLPAQTTALEIKNK